MYEANGRQFFLVNATSSTPAARRRPGAGAGRRARLRGVRAPRGSREMSRNPILDFGIDRSALGYVGEGLQRPECILAEPDGTLWSADARGGVVRIAPGSQQLITQAHSEHFRQASSEASRYLEGTLPNGLAFARNGDILISNFGTDRLEVMSRDGRSTVLADSVNGKPGRQGQLRPARLQGSHLGHRVDAGHQLDARAPARSRRRLPRAPRERHAAHRRRRIPLHQRDPLRRQGGVPLRRRDDRRPHHPPAHRRPAAKCGSARSSGRASSDRGRGPTASRSTATATCGARWSTRTSCSC